MKSQNSRNLLYIAVFQILVTVLGILGNKIAELIRIPIIWLLIATLVVLVAVIALDFYREYRNELKIGNVESMHPSLTKTKVRLGIAILQYYPLAIALSCGAIFLAYKLETRVTGLPWWIIVVPIITAILFFPRYVAQENIIGHKLKYMRFAVILALLYGGFGMSSMLVPTILSSQVALFIYAIFGNIVNVSLNMAFILYFSEMVFAPWYKRLPE
jgi:hypothetical protein